MYQKIMWVIYYTHMKILLHWVVSALAILVSAFVLPGVHVAGFVTALLLAVALGAINVVVRPVLVLLTLPITVVTFGLFLLVINTLMIMLASWIVPGFTIDGFWWALVFGVVLSVVSSLLDSMVLGKEHIA